LIFRTWWDEVRLIRRYIHVPLPSGQVRKSCFFLFSPLSKLGYWIRFGRPQLRFSWLTPARLNLNHCLVTITPVRVWKFCICFTHVTGGRAIYFQVYADTGTKDPRLNNIGLFVLQYNTRRPVLYWYCCYWETQKYWILINTGQYRAVLGNARQQQNELKENIRNYVFKRKMDHKLSFIY
jgi:hypothetical protein